MDWRGRDGGRQICMICGVDFWRESKKWREFFETPSGAPHSPQRPHYQTKCAPEGVSSSLVLAGLGFRLFRFLPPASFCILYSVFTRSPYSCAGRAAEEWGGCPCASRRGMPRHKDTVPFTVYLNLTNLSLTCCCNNTTSIVNALYDSYSLYSSRFRTVCALRN